MNRPLKYVLITFFSLFFLLFFYGHWLDHQAEREVNHRFARDEQGIILGLKTLEISNGQAHALVLVPGFMTPVSIFNTLVNDPRIRSTYDIYVPRLAFHSKNLESAAALNNQAVLDHLSTYINRLDKHYKQITYVGFSYGGALLLSLMQQGRLPPNAQVILYAPGVYMRSNTFWGNLKIYGYGLFRHYCNSDWLGCPFPVYESGDILARSYLKHEINLGYVIIPALKQVYQLDRQLRDYFKTVKRSISVIIAMDDNRIDAASIKAACLSNPHCQFFGFKSGKHVLHRGAHQAAFNSLILKLTGSD